MKDEKHVDRFTIEGKELPKEEGVARTSMDKLNELQSISNTKSCDKPFNSQRCDSETSIQPMSSPMQRMKLSSYINPTLMFDESREYEDFLRVSNLL